VHKAFSNIFALPKLLHRELSM